MRALTFRGGVHPLHKQHEGKNATKNLPLSPYVAASVTIPMRQNIGAECTPCVKKGDTVAVGQCIGTAGGFVSAPIHASVSGVVTAVEQRPHISGVPTMSVVIENDGLDTMHESVQKKGDIETLTPEEIRKIIWDSGVVGMGGATFPTHVKLSVKDDTPIDYLILNGAECEPYLTCDHRLMLERPSDVVDGARALMKSVKAPKAVIGIEDNKPDAVEAMTKACAQYSDVSVQALVTKYPQGGEKQLIKSITGREVPVGGLPSAVGVVVCNVSTAAATADAILRGLPLVWRGCTVTGDVDQPKNLIVRIGTIFQDVIDYCGGFSGKPEKILAGGPMMGTATRATDVPMTKGTNGITVLNDKTIENFKESNCMRCGKCVDACPMGLMPQTINAAYLKDKLDMCNELNALNCISCGCCSYACPAKRHLAQTVDLAKRALMARAKR